MNRSLRTNAKGALATEPGFVLADHPTKTAGQVSDNSERSWRPTISRLVTEAASLVRVEVGDLDQVDLLVKSFPMHLRVILILSYAFSLWMMVDAYCRGAAYFWFPVICFLRRVGLLFLHQNQRL